MNIKRKLNGREIDEIGDQEILFKLDSNEVWECNIYRDHLCC
jgi:hypothetical protein